MLRGICGRATQTCAQEQKHDPCLSFSSTLPPLNLFLHFLTLRSHARVKLCWYGVTMHALAYIDSCNSAGSPARRHDIFQTVTQNQLQPMCPCATQAVKRVRVSVCVCFVGMSRGWGHARRAYSQVCAGHTPRLVRDSRCMFPRMSP